MKTVISLFSVFVAFFFSCQSVALNSTESPIVTGQLFAYSPSNGYTLYLGLKLEIKKGWHIYAPGEQLGEAPKVRWNVIQEKNIKNVFWQNAEIIDTPLGKVKVYERFTCIIFETIFKEIPSKTIEATLSIPVCNESSCRLEELKVSLTFPLDTKHKINQSDIYKMKGKTEETFTEAIWRVSYIIALAFIGGLILNCMPCVLPVLSLKAISLIKLSHSHTRQKVQTLRLQGISFTLGVLSTFLSLATVLRVLRNYGISLGWGFHLQSQTFVLALILFFFLLMLNSWRIFEFSQVPLQIPRQLKNSYLISFLEGMFMTFVASPCTAPFMGTAMAYALQTNILISLGVFTALGLGLSAPVLLLCFMPKLSSWIPKPGPWMNTLRDIFGFFFLLTVLWLSWVFVYQSTTDQLFFVWTGLIFLTIIFWSYQKKTSSRLSKTIKNMVVALCAIVTFYCFGEGLNLEHNTKDWEPYNRETINQLRTEKKPYFIDFTAQWCITCQTNKKFVLHTKEVMKAFKEKNVRLFYADWTSHDPKITEDLKTYNRVGVPLYVLYKGPAHDETRVLPEILTQSKILDELKDIQTLQE